MTLPWPEFLSVWALLAANLMSPGPNVLNTIATALGSGRPAALGAAAGVGVGTGLWCLGMALGVMGVLVLLPGAWLALTALAITLLLILAWRYARLAWAGWRGRGQGLAVERDGMGFGAGLRRSLAVNAANPKALTTWLAIVTIFPVARASPVDVAVLTLGAGLLATTFHGVYALAFSTAAAARAYLRWGWVLTGLAAVLFVGFALRLGLELAFRPV